MTTRNSTVDTVIPQESSIKSSIYIYRSISIYTYRKEKIKRIGKLPAPKSYIFHGNS